MPLWGNIRHKLTGIASQNKAGCSIQADFFANLPDGLFLNDQEAKTTESRQGAGMRIRLNTLPCLMLNIKYG